MIGTAGRPAGSPCDHAGMGELTDYIAGLGEPARSVVERYRARALGVARGPRRAGATACRRCATAAGR